MSVLEYIDSDIFSPVFDNKLPLLTLQSVDEICKELFFAIKANEEIFIYGDYDMDGFCAQKVWDEVLSTLYNVPPIHFMYGTRMHKLDPDIVEQVKATKARIVIINDTGSSRDDRDILGILRSLGRVPIVIDHHDWDGDYMEDTKGMLVYNSFEERQVFNGAEISGAYSALLVAYRLCEKYFKHSLSYNAMVYALASMYSDVVDLSTSVGRALYNIVCLINMPGPALFSYFNKYDYKISRRLFSFLIAPKLNACFRMESFGLLNAALVATDRFEMKRIAEGMGEVHAEASKYTSLFVPLFEKERYGTIMLCTHDATEETRSMHVRNFSGLVANAIAQAERSAVVALIRMDGQYHGSFRDYYNRKLLPFFQLFCNAGGHPPAFGMQVNDIVETRRHIKQLTKSIDGVAQKDYTVLSTNMVSSLDDIHALALYNEYMNVKPRVMLMHRCRYVRTMLSTKYKKIYDVGLPCQVASASPLYEGVNALIEPTISRDVELRCLE